MCEVNRYVVYAEHVQIALAEKREREWSERRGVVKTLILEQFVRSFSLVGWIAFWRKIESIVGRFVSYSKCKCTTQLPLLYFYRMPYMSWPWLFNVKSIFKILWWIEVNYPERKKNQFRYKHFAWQMIYVIFFSLLQCNGNRKCKV